MARNAKEKMKKNKKNKSDSVKRKNKNSDLFSFDDELIIGVDKVKQEKNENNIKENKKKKKIKKVNKKNINNENIKKKKNNKKKKIKRELTEEEYEMIQMKKRRMFKIFKYTSILCLFVAVVIITMFSPIFNIKTITVNGNEKIPENEILSLSSIQVGENTFKISKNKVINSIKENSYVKDVIIKRKLPSEIEISIEERKVAFIVEYGGSFVYIDNQGYILEVSEVKPEVPVIQGIQTETENLVAGKRLGNIDLQRMNTVLRIMEVAESNEIASIITKIDIAYENNYKIVFENEGKAAYLGDGLNLNTIILNVKAVLDENQGVSGEIFVNMDLTKDPPIFRESV